MIQRIIDHPWIFFAFVMLLLLLNIGAAIRTRHDDKLKIRAKVNRRLKPRAGKDRRWRPRG